MAGAVSESVALMALDAWETLCDAGVYSGGGNWAEYVDDFGSGQAKNDLLICCQDLTLQWAAYSESDQNRTLVYDDWLSAALSSAFEYNGTSMLYNPRKLPQAPKP